MEGFILDIFPPLWWCDRIALIAIVNLHLLREVGMVANIPVHNYTIRASQTSYILETAPEKLMKL